MEPLMSFEGYQVIENVTKSNDLLNSFYQQMGYKISMSAKEKEPEATVEETPAAPALEKR